MTRRAFLSVLASGICVALLAGCQPGDPGSSRMYFDPIRYRLTAEVETPQGLRMGSSVIQTVWARGLSGPVVTGEAVAVDLPNGQTVFVLLRSPTNVAWAGRVPGVEPPRNTEPLLPAEGRVVHVGRQVAWILANRDTHFLWGNGVPPERAQYLPYMVRFRDVADPASVEQLDPKNFSEVLGKGYKLRSLSVRITTDPVTSGIDTRLRWLGRYPEPRLVQIPPGGVVNPVIAQRLAHGDFRRGAQ